MAKGLLIRLGSGCAAARATALLLGLALGVLLSAGSGSASGGPGTADDPASTRFILDAGLVPAAAALTQDAGNGKSPADGTETRPFVSPPPTGTVARAADAAARPLRHVKPLATGPPVR
ncbi:MAG TPA: hypothetical protein VK943_16725 [Arenibaculum sp.]|nr:hypothetical protein [Arenibaculum sp.]